MKTLLLALLFLLPACSENTVTAPLDSAGSGDVLASDAGAPADAFGSDVPTLDGGGVGPDATGGDGGTTEDGGVALDAGRDAWTSSTAVCGDGFVDAPETCDPAYVGGMHNSISCPTTGAGACSWCRWGLLASGGCLYGDYLSEVRPPGSTSACRDSANNDLSWVVWHSAAGRDEIVAAYRSIGATANVAGWIGLTALHDTAPFVWRDDNSEPTPDILFAFRNTRTTGRNCVTLTVTPTEAYLRYESCSATTVVGLCVTQPWGIPR